MRKFALSMAAVVLLAAPAAAQADERGKLTAREARSAARAWVTVQVEALEQFQGLSVAATRVSAHVDRVGPRRILVPVAFGVHWDDGRDFVCLNNVHVTKRGRSVHAQPGSFDC
jgi:hypothetical protein